MMINIIADVTFIIIIISSPLLSFMMSELLRVA